jgi:hypothetical protein
VLLGSVADGENLKRHLAFIPSEYSYFDKERMSSGKGPHYWKFRLVGFSVWVWWEITEAKSQPRSSEEFANKISETLKVVNVGLGKVSPMEAGLVRAEINLFCSRG